MSKKSLAITTLILLILVAGFLGFFYYTSKNGTDGLTSLINNLPFFGGEEATTTAENNFNANADISTDIQNPALENLSEVTVPKLRQVSSVPVSGATIIQNKSTSTIRYMERANGHILETPTNSMVVERVSNTTVPKIYEALWVEGGSSVIARGLKDDNETIQSFYGKIKKVGMQNATSSDSDSESLASLTGLFLPENLKQIVASPSGKQIFFLSNNLNTTNGFVANADGSKKVNIFESTAKEWLVSWPREDSLILTTKPSAGIVGYAYVLNTKTQSFNKIASGIGLTALANPTLSKVLYAKGGASLSSLGVTTIKDGMSLPLYKETLPEKCVWGVKNVSMVYCAVPKYIPDGNYPDDWYKGLVFFSDEIWKINADNGVGEKVADLKDLSGQDIDAINPILNISEDYLVFMNKKDLTLWSLRVVEPTVATTTHNHRGRSAYGKKEHA